MDLELAFQTRHGRERERLPTCHFPDRLRLYNHKSEIVHPMERHRFGYLNNLLPRQMFVLNVHLLAPAVVCIRWAVVAQTWLAFLLEQWTRDASSLVARRFYKYDAKNKRKISGCNFIKYKELARNCIYSGDIKISFDSRMSRISP